ncbi:hypothetical protein DSO57_1039294 [Entomophthora muscae]|uniref:Uncharacterized protein n=1 Tax=Entomophthora muscae TaxID=34485 RepID=A0ACC2RPB7_9FUNG|nr:hypothetical protein DSO57_1039294 [Entomophthora muscae]
MTPFQANLGYTPSFLPNLQGYFCSQSAAKLATTIKETQAQLVSHLQSAILDYKKHCNKKRIPGSEIQPSSWYSSQLRISQPSLPPANSDPVSSDPSMLLR